MTGQEFKRLVYNSHMSLEKIAKEMGLSLSTIYRRVHENELDDEFVESVMSIIAKKRVKSDKCKTCYYRSTLGNGCSYILFFHELRDCDPIDCNKYLDKEQDFDDRIGCGSCNHYNYSDDVFNGTCWLKQKPVQAYTPSCEVYSKLFDYSYMDMRRKHGF